MKANRISLPFCILILFALGVVFRSLFILKQSESEAKLREEVQALADEFGLEFTDTLSELVTRGIVSPTLAANLEQSFDQNVVSNEDNEKETEESLEGENREREQSQEPEAGSIFFHADKWMVPGERYFVYQPAGGLSNQRIMLESALIVGKLLNRTVIVPQLGPHTSMWYNFNNIPLEDFIPADELLDEAPMKVLSRVRFLKGPITFRQFIANNESPQTWFRVMRDKLDEKRLHPWDMEYLIDHFGHIDSPVMIFARGTMWECFDFPPEVIDTARRAVRAHPVLRSLAREVSRDLFPDGFNSLHIRFMDDDGTNLREGLLKPAPSFIFRMKQFDKEIPLYIATVPKRRDTAYFNAFTRVFKTIQYGDVLEQDERVKAQLETYTKKMKDTVLGLVEQLVCARAEKFLGTGFSTFSEHIRRMRRWRELVAVENLFDAEERERERRFVMIETPCLSPLMPC